MPQVYPQRQYQTSPTIIQPPNSSCIRSPIRKITLHVIAFPSCAILLANAAPSSTVLGSINGVAASMAGLSRSFVGPTVTSILHTKGLESGFSGLSWWVCGVVSVIGAIESCWIEQVDPRWREA